MRGVMEQWVNEIVAGIVATVLAAITWLVRTVLTNNRKIELLEKEISSRDERRKEDRAIVEEIKSDMKDLRKELHELSLSLKR
jgi:type VI protein secretion system component VasK